MANSAISTSLLDPMKTKTCRKHLRDRYYKEVRQSWELNALEEVLETETRAEEVGNGIKFPNLSGTEGDFLLKESKEILRSLKDASKSDRSNQPSEEAKLKKRCLIVLIKLQKQQLSRQCGTAEHKKLCKALTKFDKETGTSGEGWRENPICKIAKTFCDSKAAREDKDFLRSTDELNGDSGWNDITPWMEKFEVLHENFIQIAPLNKLPEFKSAYNMLKRIYQTASTKDLPTQEVTGAWAFLKAFSSEASKTVGLFLKQTLHGNKGKKLRSKLQKLMPDLPIDTADEAKREFRRKCCEDLIGSTTFEILTKCHEIVQALTKSKDEPTGFNLKESMEKDKSALENLKNYMEDHVKWDEIKNCLQCKEVDMKSSICEALTSNKDLKYLKKNILSDLDASCSSQEWEAVRLHKEAFDALKEAEGIKIHVRKYLLRELDRRCAECKDFKSSAHAKRSLERILDGQELPADDRQYLFSIMEDPSSCEHCKNILSLQEVYQDILEDKELSLQQTHLLLAIYSKDVSCRRCSLIGSDKTQASEDDTCRDLRHILQIHSECKICLDMLLCLKTHKSMSQEAPLENDTRDFVSRILKNVENEWKCEGKSTNCMEVFLELCKNELSPKSQSDIIEKLNGERSSICPYCQDQMWEQTIKCVRDEAALQKEQVEFVQDIILSHACKGCCMLMEQIKVRKTLEESKVLSSNLRALLSEKILPRTSYCKSYHQLKSCMSTLEKLTTDDILTQDDEHWIKHISDATKDCEADGCNASHEEELIALDQESRCAIIGIWDAGLKCESCHAKLLHVSEAVHSQVDEKYSKALNKIREHLSDEQRLECNICEGFHVPQEPLNLNHLQFEDKITPLQMEEMLGATLRFPAVISKNRERKRESKKGSSKKKGSDRDSKGMTGEKCGNEDEAVTKEKDPLLRGFHPLTSTSGDRGCQEEDQDEDSTNGALSNNFQCEDGKVTEEKKHSWKDTTDSKCEKAASGSKSLFLKQKGRAQNKLVASTGKVAKAAEKVKKSSDERKRSSHSGKGMRGNFSHQRGPRGGKGGPKESLASVQSKIQDQGRDEKEGQKPKVPKKRNSVDNSVGEFEEMAAIDDVVNVLLKWRKKHGIPLCILTNYNYTGICGKRKEIASSSHGEIDIIGFSLHLGVLFVELKAVSPEGSNIKRSLRLAQEQLQRDEIFFLEVNRDWLRDGDIPVIPLIALPYVTCSILAKMGLCNLHKSRVLTKCDMDKFILEPGNWNKFIGIPSKKLVVNRNDYCKLVERFYGYKHFMEAPYSLAKGVKTVGRDMSNIFFAEDQREGIMAENIPYQFVAGGYGTGKSLMLVLKAKEIAKGKLNASDTSQEKSIFMISCTDITVSGKKINIEQPDGSLNHLKRLMGNENHPSPSYFDHIEFLMVKDFFELTPKTEAGEDLAETLANAIKSMASLLPEVHFFFDEIPFKFLKNFKPHIEKLILKIPSIKTFWFSVATHSFRADASDHQNADWVKCECPKNFNFKYLKENLRVPGNTLRLQKQFEKAMDDGHGGTERGHVPPGPKPLLYRVPLCNCQNVQDHSITLGDNCSRRRMTATLRAMFTKLGILVSDQAMATTYREWPSNSITMLLPSVTDTSFENDLSDLLKHSCAELGIDLEDRRYKTQPGGNAANPSHVTGHWEVTCQEQPQAEAPNTEQHVNYLQVPSLVRTLSTESDYGLDSLEKHNNPVSVQDGASTSRQEPTERPKITLTTETGFFNCESYVIISVDLSAMMYCFRGSKVAYSTCGISRCLSQYVHLTWHFKEAKEFFMAQSEFAADLSEKEIEYALRMKPSLEKFLEEGHIVEETVE